MQRILFLEDDAFQMKYHVLELRTLFEVELRSEVDRALNDFREISAARGPWTGVVLDIMMPPGTLAKSCPDGMHTGCHMFNELRRLQPGLPVIVFTNLRDEYMKDWFRDQPNVLVLDKLYVSPRDLCAAAKKLFSA